ncbi:hypothetical protein AMECASPLE_003676 [Ameca splendens]|uniref:Uncharacterized protein n=1 Tax=Ameca splendens TaxID=208324 RepID=A0ABV0XMM8_9TELE
MNLLTFLYQTDFQLSLPDMAVWRKSLPASFVSRYPPPMRSPERHAGNGNKSSFSAGFIVLGDVRAAASVEVCLFNCPTKMDDSNKAKQTKQKQSSGAWLGG